MRRVVDLFKNGINPTEVKDIVVCRNREILHFTPFALRMTLFTLMQDAIKAKPPALQFGLRQGEQ